MTRTTEAVVSFILCHRADGDHDDAHHDCDPLSDHATCSWMADRAYAQVQGILGHKQQPHRIREESSGERDRAHGTAILVKDHSGRCR